MVKANDDEQPFDENARQEDDPTPAEIRQRAAVIREAWSAKKHARRKVTHEETWRPPLVLICEVVANIKSDSSQN